MKRRSTFQGLQPLNQCTLVITSFGNDLKGRQAGLLQLTKRDELSFLTVLAFPKASKIGFAASSCFSNSAYTNRKIHH